MARNVDPRAELSAASTVVAVLLTGAFILQNFGVSSILNLAFIEIIGRQPPSYYGVAIGAIGAFAVLYQILYVFLLSPLNCYTDREIGYSTEISFDTLEISDFINLFMVFLVYEYLVYAQQITGGYVLLGGFVIIVTSLVFRILPRWVGSHLEQDCFWTIKIVLVTIPVSILAYLPAMYIVSLG